MSARRVALLLAVIAVMLCTTLISCSRDDVGGDDTTDGSTFVPETTPGAQLVAAGALEAMILKDGWKVRRDPDGLGKKAGWYKTKNPTGVDIQIPGRLTDVDSYASEAWFSVKFDSNLEVSTDQRVYLELTGTGYMSTAWLNGIEVGSHLGSYGTYTLDVTDAMKYDESNVLYLYVCAPSATFEVDGIAGSSLPTAHAVPCISGPVYLYVKPDVSIKDMYVQPSTEDGSIKMTVTVNNMSDKAVTATLGAKVHENAKTMINDRTSTTVTVPAGESVHEITLQVPDFRYWNTDSPVLYNVTATLDSGERVDEFTVRTGFKDLRVDKDGYYVLNGERIFIKSTHTTTYMQGTIGSSADIKQYYNLLLYLKSCGFNTVRYLNGAALPEILQMCDEIGLLVYEEHNLAWQKVDCEKTPEIFHQSVEDVLLRDRNHVSLGIFGMLNETFAADNTLLRFNAAVDELQAARKIAPNLLFQLSSGRWDGYLNIGSASNPGSDTWDGYMGAEDAGNSKRETEMIWSWIPGMGDVHYYPYTRVDISEIRKTYEKLTAYKRAVFLSEAGMGSQSNIISEYLQFEQNGYPTGHTAYECLKQQVADYRNFFEEYGLDRIWSSPEAVLEDTEAYQTRQRAMQLTMIRRVDGFNGYSMTMTHDAGFRGEGIVEGGNYYKPGATEMLQDGLDDLRFCITVDNSHIKAGTDADLEVVISNFGVLKTDRDYEVVVRITGEKGVVWKKQVTVQAGESTIVKVLDEKISTNGWKSGTYTIGAEMLEGAHPTCGTETFYVTNIEELPRIEGSVTVLGLSTSVPETLRKLGADVKTFTTAAAVGNGTLFVGSKELTSEELEAIYEAAKNGAHVVFLSPKALSASGYLNVPFVKQGKVETYGNWLYHYDGVVFENPIMKGLQTNCIMDHSFYYGIYSEDFISGMSLPTDISVATFFAGIDGGNERAFSCGYQLGTYSYGKGYITLNTLNLISGCDTPAAMTIFANLANYQADADSSTGPVYSGEQPDVMDVINFNKGSIKLDGILDEKEWGTPFIKGMNAEQAMADANDLYTVSSKSAKTSFDMYMAYDDNYIYAAAVIYDLQPAAAKNAKKWAGFGIMLSRYTEGTVVPHIVYEGNEFEQYTHIRYFMLANGEVVAEVQNEGIDWTAQKAGDYTAKYDEETQTLVFEVRIPINQTNVNKLEGGNQVAVSAFVRMSMLNGNESTGTKFQYATGITNPRGAGKTPMKNGSGILVLGKRS